MNKRNKILFLIFIILFLQTSCGDATETSISTKTSTSSVPVPTITLTPTALVTEQEVITPTSENKKSKLIFEEHNLEWHECELPKDDYLNRFAAENCLGIEKPSIDSSNILLQAERIKTPSLIDLKLTVGNDIYETRHEPLEGMGMKYKLFKNDRLLASATANFTTFDLNRSLFEYKGNIVWELADANNPTVFVNKNNLREKCGFDAVFYPYVLNEKLIFSAKDDGEHIIVYDNEIIGPRFDDIHIAYCCGPARYTIHRSRNIYWFWGVRDNNYYVVVIKGIES